MKSKLLLNLFKTDIETFNKLLVMLGNQLISYHQAIDQLKTQAMNSLFFKGTKIFLANAESVKVRTYPYSEKHMTWHRWRQV